VSMGSKRHAFMDANGVAHNDPWFAKRVKKDRARNKAARKQRQKARGK